MISRFEAKGLMLQRMRMLTPDEPIAGQHYGEHEGKPFYPSLIEFITSGPVVAMGMVGRGRGPRRPVDDGRNQWQRVQSGDHPR